MLIRLNFAKPVACLALMVGMWGCSDNEGPTAPVVSDEPLLQPPAAPQPQTGSGILDDRAHTLPSADFQLLSSAEELEAGRYRFRPRDDELPDVVRDDFIVVDDADGGRSVRRVLEATVNGGELVMDTGFAYWHEILRPGAYTLTMPLGGDGPAQFTAPGAEPISVLNEEDLATLEKEFTNADVCAWLHEVLELLPGAHQREVCGKEVDMEVGWFELAGTLDSLHILSGNVRLTGDATIGLEVDAGGISGGRRPVFYPCNLRAYPGCLNTPTGANLIEFLRQYAPSIPEGSLTPNRVCVPGTPVRISAGYWSGWTWNRAQWLRCAVTDFGALPTVTLPSIETAVVGMEPRVQGELTIRAIGDGSFTLEVPVPGLGLKKGFRVSDGIAVKAAVGVFIQSRITLRNGGGTVRLVFDDTGVLEQRWFSDLGWAPPEFDLDREFHSELLDLINPDSTILRYALPIKAKVELCLSLLSACEAARDSSSSPQDSTRSWMNILGKKLFKVVNIGVEAGVGVAALTDIVHTREQVHPDDPDVDNWHLSNEVAYELTANAGVRIPLTGWILPQVPREIGDTWECCRIPIGDYWGQGRLEVSATTTGVDRDTDGYRVIVERADSLPAVLDPGVRRAGNGWATQPFEQSIGIDGTAEFGRDIPCIAVYSDALLTVNPVWGISVAGARATGLNVPTWGGTSPCRWLIARYRVTLEDVAANCIVEGGAVRDSVWLQQLRLNPERDNVRRLGFTVECGVRGSLGNLIVVLDERYHSPDVTPSVLVDGETAAVFASDTVRLNGLAPGSYELELRGLRPLCRAAAWTETVVGGDAVVTPNVVCAMPDPTPGTVTYQATTTGDGTDANGYSIMRDGAAAEQLRVNGSATVTGIPASQPTVLQVTDIAGNCQAQGPNPRVFTLDAARTPVDLPFAVVCSAARPDTLIGEIDATAWPASRAALVTADGATLAVNGPLATELVRLTGTPVRVWGRVSATGFDVHGYDLRSQLGADRWLGIVLQRQDGLWLFGEEAVLLKNPPAGLAGESGKLVWVMGYEVEGGVRPTVYGVIRGG